MQNNEYTNSTIKEEYIKIQDKADKLFLKLTYASIVIALVIGTIYNNLLLSIFLSASQFLVFFLSKRFITNRTIKTYALGITFGFWATLFVPIANGYFLVNYIYFAYYVLLIIYHEKKLLLIGPVFAFVYNLIIFSSINYNFFKEFIVNNYKSNGIYSIEELIWGIIANISIGFSAYILASLLESKTVSDIKYNIEQAEQIKTFERYKKFALEVENNHFELQKGITSDDSIGKSLNNIKKKLSDAIKKEEHEKFLSNFNNEGVNLISEIIRIQNINLTELSYLLISGLVKYLKANQGAIFIVEEELSGEKYLDLKAAYAYERKKNMAKKILPGEGVIGTAFIENKSVYLTKLPDNYLYLKSGLGKTKPRALIAQTISYNNKIVGVLEIASLNEFKEYELKFIEQVSEYIASTIISEKARTKTSKLLNKSTEITNKMRIKEQELNDKIQELEIQNKEFQTKIEEISKQ